MGVAAASLQPGGPGSEVMNGGCSLGRTRSEALIGEAWFVVPSDKVLQRTDNPTGRAVVCWTPQRGIVCFVRATES